MQETRKYETQSIRYLNNALRLLQAGDIDKASEFLWGSVAQAVKAVAASKGHALGGHGQILNYARQLGRELKDEDIYPAAIIADSLHHNFYEVEKTREDVELDSLTIRQLVGKLLALIEG